MMIIYSAGASTCTTPPRNAWHGEARATARNRPAESTMLDHGAAVRHGGRAKTLATHLRGRDGQTTLDGDAAATPASCEHSTVRRLAPSCLLRGSRWLWAARHSQGLRLPTGRLGCRSRRCSVPAGVEPEPCAGTHPSAVRAEQGACCDGGAASRLPQLPHHAGRLVDAHVCAMHVSSTAITQAAAARPRPARLCTQPQRRSPTRSMPGLRRRATELWRHRPTWTSSPSRRMHMHMHMQCTAQCTCSAAHCSPTLRMSPMVATTPNQTSARVTSLRFPVPDLTASRSPPRPASALITASAPITAAVCLRLHPCALYAASPHASACALHPCCPCLAPCLRPAPQPPPMLPPITAATSAPSALHTTSTKTVTSLGRSR